MLHFPVMSEEALQGLAIKDDGIYLDCTFGRGGHSHEMLKCLNEYGRLLAFDRDVDAVNSEIAGILRQDSRFELRHCCFSDLEGVVVGKDWQGKVDGIVMDLGVSSPQLDDPKRGFSFLKDGPLDMRMDSGAGINAAQWLAETDEREIARVLIEYGEERFARRIAKAIVKDRVETPFLSTRQLAELIERIIPVREKNKHPATRSFQAIRIEINQELHELKEGLNQAIHVLKPGGRLVVISFHSLEDRIVKRLFRDESRGKYSPRKRPVDSKSVSDVRLKKMGKALRASQSEIKKNPRSRSAIMRVAERI